jgi:hypothetical protein
VAVALVDGAVGGEEVEIVLILGVPDAASTRSREDCEAEFAVRAGGLGGRRRRGRGIPMGSGW